MKMEWIKCSESLPEDKQEVMFKGQFPFEGKGFFERTEKGYSFYHKSSDSNKIYHIHGVTHWMELPEKPS